MLAKTVLTVERKGSAARNARGFQQHTANSVKSVTTTALTSLRKSVLQDFGYLTSAMAASRSVSVL